MPRARRLGVFGGTFNPIHVGHLLLAETAREALNLDRVLFVPTGRPPHKVSRDLPPGSMRLRLIQAALRGHPAFAASNLEIARPGRSYSLDTIRQLRARFPHARLFLLIGQDMLGVRWRGWEAIRRLCTVVVAHRSGSARRRRPPHVTWLSMPQIDISSSEIRRRVRQGRYIRYLVMPAVESLMRRHRLYQGGRWW